MRAAGEGVERALARRVVVCCGSGGVGKTTVSAALGLAAARRGRRVLVCTIDPAKRLANALGIKELANEAYEVPRATIEGHGLAMRPGGSLSAMMLDTKRTFDRLIERHAASPEVAARILANHVYKQFSSQLAGSQEYMAMEKLFELYHEGGYDLIVLDTPPSRHALDFLHAPERLASFLDASVLKWFLMPLRGAAGGLAGKVAQKVLGLLDSLFGMKSIEDIADFFAAFEPLWGGFKERAERVNALLRQTEIASFLVVSSATRDTIEEALYFHEQLNANRLPMRGFVVNRVHRGFAGGIEETPLGRAAGSREGAEALAGEVSRLMPDEPLCAQALAGAVRAFHELERFAQTDRDNLARIRGAAARDGHAFVTIPAFERDVYDLASLAVLDPILVPSDPIRAS